MSVSSFGHDVGMQKQNTNATTTSTSIKMQCALLYQTFTCTHAYVHTEWEALAWNQFQSILASFVLHSISGLLLHVFMCVWHSDKWCSVCIKCSTFTIKQNTKIVKMKLIKMQQRMDRHHDHVEHEKWNVRERGREMYKLKVLVPFSSTYVF